MNIIANLPSNAQQLIYDYTGVCLNTKKIKDTIIKYFNSGHIGIPSWIHEFRNETGVYVREFEIPSYSYFLRRKIQCIQWNYPKDLDNFIKYYDNTLIMRDLIILYCPSNKLQLNLRNDVFGYPGDEYLIFAEGCFEWPVIPIPFRFIDDYDILFSLKYARGDNKQDCIKNLLHWGLFQLKFESEICRYIYRIINKWQKLAIESD